jgi:hypothetical protein
MTAVEIEQWQGPFAKPIPTLVEVAYVSGVRHVLRRFDISGLQLVQVTADDFSIDPPSPSEAPIG